MKTKYILCAFGELALKGKNRKVFENFLKKDMEAKAKKVFGVSVKKIEIKRRGVLVELINKIDMMAEVEMLNFVPGIVWYAPVVICKTKIENIQENIFEISKGLKFESFKISASRSNKSIKFTSQDINSETGKKIYEDLSKKVNLTNPDITFFISADIENTFIYIKKFKGMGGLPLGSSGKGVLLLSGGIDSPVAGYMMMKRGVEVIAVHFHAIPRTSKEAIEKVNNIVKQLKKIQPDIKLWLASVANIQKEISKHCSESNRIVLLRRFMIRIANEIAIKELASTIITGDSLGQVASQTIENLKTINSVVNTPILRPLIAYDKQEIINIANKLRTYEISILRYKDSCEVFAPSKPATKSSVDKIEKEEKLLDVDGLVLEAVDGCEIVKI